MNPVQQKISCVYKTGVLDEPSGKRQHQMFRVSAFKQLNSQACEDGVSFARATEKIDGTCCLIADFRGQPWLWARHDRKPSKVGERRFAQYKKAKTNSDGKLTQAFDWDPVKDFKDVPDHWMPAFSLEVRDGLVMPDQMGHTPGWVPVQRHVRQHCWHTEAVDLKTGSALVLREDEEDGGGGCGNLLIESMPLSGLLGQTCELIGTNINGNPYGLGCKKNPFHVLVPHGAIAVVCPDPSDFDRMWEWMDSETIGTNRAEGVVWHCGKGKLYKLHRHHLNLKWPVDDPWLCRRKIRLRVDSPENGSHDEYSTDSRPTDAETASQDKVADSLFKKLFPFSGHSFNSLKTMCDKTLTC